VRFRSPHSNKVELEPSDFKFPTTHGAIIIFIIGKVYEKSEVVKKDGGDVYV
jgi:hypothetical protein